MVADDPRFPPPKRRLNPGEVRYDVDALKEIAKIFQSQLGSDRESCDESGQRMWDRIEAAVNGERA